MVSIAALFMCSIAQKYLSAVSYQLSAIRFQPSDARNEMPDVRRQISDWVQGLFQIADYAELLKYNISQISLELEEAN